MSVRGLPFYINQDNGTKIGSKIPINLGEILNSHPTGDKYEHIFVHSCGERIAIPVARKNRSHYVKCAGCGRLIDLNYPKCSACDQVFANEMSFKDHQLECGGSIRREYKNKFPERSEEVRT